MISLYGQTAAPNRGSGMAINGFILFIGASIGPILGRAITNLSALAIVLVALLLFAAGAIFCFSLLNREETQSVTLSGA